MDDTHRPDWAYRAGSARPVSEVGLAPVQRPPLHIETSFPPTRLVRPVPLRLAEVARPAKTSTYGDFAAAQRRTSSLWNQEHARAKVPQTAGRRNREFAVMTFDFDPADENAVRRLTDVESDLLCGGDDTDDRLLRVGVNNLDVDVDIAPRPKAARGHRRRLSDTVKSFLTFGRTSISSHDPDETPPDEGRDRDRLEPPSRIVIVPPRPYRSPGTASYLVSRHPGSLDDEDGSETEYTSSRRSSQWSDATSATARASVHTFGSGWKPPLHVGDAVMDPSEEDRTDGEVSVEPMKRPVLEN